MESANRFRIIEDGVCSFCEKERGKDLKLAEEPSSSIKICGDCASLCVEILSEGDMQSPPSAEDWNKRLASLRATQRAWNESKMKEAPISSEQPMMSLKADQLKDMLGADVHIKLDDATAAAKTTCSVCGTSAEKVQRVIAGPSVHICNQCVGEAVRAINAA